MTKRTFQNFPLDDLTGGINVRDYPSEIEDKQSQELTNWNFKWNKLITSPGSIEKYDVGAGGYVSGITQDGEDVYSISPSNTTENLYHVTFWAIDWNPFSIEIDGVKKVYLIGFFNNEATALSTLLTTLQADFPTYTITGAWATKIISNGVNDVVINNPQLVKTITLNSWDADAKIGITIDWTTYTRTWVESASAWDVLDWVVTQLPWATYKTKRSGSVLHIWRIDATAISISETQYNRYTYDIQYKYADTFYTWQYPDYTSLTIDWITSTYDYTSNGRGYFWDRQVNYFKDIDLWVNSLSAPGSWFYFWPWLWSWIRIYVKQNCKIKTVTAYDGSHNWVRLRDDAWTVLQTWTRSYPTWTLNYDLVAWNYYRVEVSNPTSSVQWANWTLPTWPVFDMISWSWTFWVPSVMTITVDTVDDPIDTVRSTLYRKSGGGTDSVFNESNRAQYYNQYHSFYIRKTNYSSMSISSINKYTDSVDFPNDTAFTFIYTTNHLATITVGTSSLISYSTLNTRSFWQVHIYKNWIQKTPNTVYFCWVYTTTNSESYKVRMDGLTEYTYTADGSATEAEIVAGMMAAIDAGWVRKTVAWTRSTSGLTSITSWAPTWSKAGFYVYKLDLSTFTLQADSDYLWENDMAKGLMPSYLLEDDIYLITKSSDWFLIVWSRGFAPIFVDPDYIQYEYSTQAVWVPNVWTLYQWRAIFGWYGNDTITYSQPDKVETTAFELMTMTGYPANVQWVSEWNSWNVVGFHTSEDWLYVFKNNSIHKTNTDKDTGTIFTYIFSKITDNWALSQRTICWGWQEVFYYDHLNRAIRRLSYEQNLTTLRDTSISSEIEDLLRALPEDDEANDERFTKLWSLNYTYPYLEFNYSDETSPYIYTSWVDENLKYRLPNKTLVYNVYNKSWSKRTEKEDNAPMCVAGNYFWTTDWDVWLSNYGFTNKEGTSLSKEYTFTDDVDFKRIGELEIVGDITWIGWTKTLEVGVQIDETDAEIGLPATITRRIIEATDWQTVRFRERIDLFDDWERMTFSLDHSWNGKIEISDVNIKWKPLQVFHWDFY